MEVVIMVVGVCLNMLAFCFIASCILSRLTALEDRIVHLHGLIAEKFK